MRNLPAVLGLVLLAGTASVPATAIPPYPTVAGYRVRCVVVHEELPQCSYRANGEGTVVSAHRGDWRVQILRLGDVIWQQSGDTFNRISVPSKAGDHVQVQIRPQSCGLNQLGKCIAGGPMYAFEKS